MSGRDGGVLRRHVPDFLLRTETGFVVVDVNPERMLADPSVSAGLRPGLPGRARLDGEPVEPDPAARDQPHHQAFLVEEPDGMHALGIC